jgi:hypothetical protein
MTSVLGLEISIFRIPMDSAGSQLISQQCGYFHLWRFLNVDGSVSLDGEMGASFGGQWNAERIPFTYNTRLALGTPVDRVLLEWNAQPGKTAEILLTRDPRGLDGQNTPAKQLVIQQGSASASNSNATVGTAAASIVAANTSRARAVIQSNPLNTANIYLGQTGLTVANGIILSPGAAYEWRASNAVFAIADAAGQNVRIMQEAF